MEDVMTDKKLRRRGFLKPDSEKRNVVINERGTGFVLGESVYWVWKKCDGETPKGRLIEGFVDVFDVSREESAEAVESIISNLEELNLL